MKKDSLLLSLIIFIVFLLEFLAFNYFFKLNIDTALGFAGVTVVGFCASVFIAGLFQGRDYDPEK